MEQKRLQGEKGFDADESPHALVDNYEQPTHDFVTEMDNTSFEIVKCSQELDLTADGIASDLLELVK